MLEIDVQQEEDFAILLQENKESISIGPVLFS